MKLLKILYNTFKYEESLNNINYNVIQNLRNFEEIFGLNKIQVYEKFLMKGKNIFHFYKILCKVLVKRIY